MKAIKYPEHIKITGSKRDYCIHERNTIDRILHALLMNLYNTESLSQILRCDHDSDRRQKTSWAMTTICSTDSKKPAMGKGWKKHHRMNHRMA